MAEDVKHGLSNPAIAALCDLTLNAVKFHVSSALGKLGLSSRRELQQWSGVRADSALANAGHQDRSTAWARPGVPDNARPANDSGLASQCRWADGDNPA